MEVTFIFPHQLFRQHPGLDKNRTVILIEDHLYFSQYKFHKQKLVLHRASLKRYETDLQQQGFHTHYIESANADLGKLLQRLKNDGIHTIHYVEVTDYLLDRRLTRFAKRHAIQRTTYPSPDFINTTELNSALMKGEKRYLMANFYIKQRKRLNILVEDESPVGGKWSFDTENRQRIPKGISLPSVFIPKESDFVKEAKDYVQQHFKDNPGEVEPFPYPITFDDAEKVLKDFLRHRMQNFGAYEDAILQQESVLFHSWLTPALNIGLITPNQVIGLILKTHRQQNFPLNSLEGFIRQIIGWREFMRLMYEQKGVVLRTNNHFQFGRKIPASFYHATTGIEPVDQTIRKVLQTGYCHHIERLMILGNFMLLCEFDPDEVYRWFMELFIDAYDWVMVPNVYGMSQYADGGLMTTKPYVSGSSYVLKMSDYSKGDWCETWDALYWRFIYNHRKEFSKNPRMSMMVSLVNKMDEKKLKRHLQVANQFLAAL